METNTIIDNDMQIPPCNKIISGFWRRILAFIIDAIILWLTGIFLGIFLFDFFAHLGGWGHLVGFCIALVYFGVLNSSIGKGKTVGKRIMKIEVVDKAGNYISLHRSFLRYTILAVPFFLNGVMIPSNVLSSLIEFIIGFIVLGFGGAIIYLYIFNRRTRQGLHDLIMGTYIVRTGQQGEVLAGTIWKTHFVIIGIWCLTFVGGFVISPLLIDKESFTDFIAVQEKIEASGKVHAANVYSGKIWALNGDTRAASYFQVQAFLKERPEDYDAEANDIAFIVLDSYPEIMKKDVLSITVTYGYDIGIFSAWINQAVQHSPQEWQKIREPKVENKK
jgi:uncharacterized RDD family membrane protein YckC